MHRSRRPARRHAGTSPALWLAAALCTLALPLAAPALSHAEGIEGELANPNNYECFGHIAAGAPENEEAEEGTSPVKYSFACNGPITGYQVQSQLPIVGFSSAPVATNEKGEALTSSFSCAGEFPGYAVNCVGAAPKAFEILTGQFSIESSICTEPRVDPLLTVTYAYLEKGVVTQAISGPFDLGRPQGCKAGSGKTRLTLNPVKEAQEAKAKAKVKKTAKKAKPKKKTKKASSKKAA